MTDRWNWSRRRVAHTALALSMIATSVLAGCSDSSSPLALAGTYKATTFVVTPAGQSTYDFLALGGSFTATIRSDGGVTGTVFFPDAYSVGGGYTVDYSGTIVPQSDGVRFNGAPGTFFGESVWSVGRGTLSVQNATVNDVTFTITLRRQ